MHKKNEDPYEAYVSFRLTKAQLETLDQSAKREGRTRSGWIRWKLEEFLHKTDDEKNIRIIDAFCQGIQEGWQEED